MDIEVEKIFIDILKSEMGIANDNIWISGQNYEIPNTEDMFVIVGMADAQVISNVNRFETTETTITEVQEVIQRENIQIDFLSRSTEARQKRWQFEAALNSIYSKQKQEENNFRIFKIPTSFVNTSVAEGGSQLNRYTLVIPCNVWYRKTKAIEENNYYDDFDTRVDDENTIGEVSGIIEFNISSNVDEANGTSSITMGTIGSTTINIPASAQSNISTSIVGNTTLILPASGTSAILTTATATSEGDILGQGQSNVNVSVSGDGVLNISAIVQSDISTNTEANALVNISANGSSDIATTLTGEALLNIPATSSSSISTSISGNATLDIEAQGQSDIALSVTGNADVSSGLVGNGESDITVSATGTTTLALTGNGTSSISVSATGSGNVSGGGTTDAMVVIAGQDVQLDTAGLGHIPALWKV